MSEFLTSHSEDSGEGVEVDIRSVGGKALKVSAVMRQETRNAIDGDNVAETNNEELMRRAGAFCNVNKSFFKVFSEDSSISYKPSAGAETFAFYPEEGKVEIPTAWFDGEHSDAGLHFASAHELCHYVDMRENPKEYLRNFDKFKKKGAKWAEEFCGKHPDVSKKRVAAVISRELHTLYNCLDDVYVNNLVMHKSGRFAKNDHVEVVELYKKLGFEKDDMREMPKHLQMAYSLLRDEMISEECGPSVLSDDVVDFLDKKRFGVSRRDRMSGLKPKNGKKIDPKERYEIIERTFEEGYINFLMEDIEKQLLEPQNEDENGRGDESGDSEESGKNNGGEKEKNNGGSNNSEEGEDGENEDEGKEGEDGEGEDDDIFKKHKKKKFFNDHENDKQTRDTLDKFEEDKLSPEEKQKRQLDRQKKVFDEKHGISPECRKEFDETVKSISEARRKMREFWNGLIGKSIELRKKTEYDQLRGKIDTEHPVDTYLKIRDGVNAGNVENLKIFQREIEERVSIDRPEEIQISLIVDGSGSMSGDRIQAAREAATLLMMSIVDFNRKLESNRKETKSNLTAKTQVLMFGDGFEEVKPFEKERISNAAEAEVIKSVSQMTSDFGGTYDSQALEHIDGDISDEDRERIKDGRLVKIVFEITDGETFTPDDSKRIVEKMVEEGILTFGFQIGYGENGNCDVFDSVWGMDDPNKKRGVYVRDINALPGDLISVLSKFLKDIRI